MQIFCPEGRLSGSLTRRGSAAANVDFPIDRLWFTKAATRSKWSSIGSRKRT